MLESIPKSHLNNCAMFDQQKHHGLYYHCDVALAHSLGVNPICI